MPNASDYLIAGGIAPNYPVYETEDGQLVAEHDGKKYYFEVAHTTHFDETHWEEFEDWTVVFLHAEDRVTGETVETDLPDDMKFQVESSYVGERAIRREMGLTPDPDPERLR